jgi:hypothetical protein
MDDNLLAKVLREVEATQMAKIQAQMDTDVNGEHDKRAMDEILRPYREALNDASAEK